MGLFTNCINFLLIEVIIIFFAFNISRMVFRVVSKFAISQILRKYDFWLYFLILIFEGNVQQFTFYLTAELRTIFAFEWINKIVKVFIISFGYSVFIFSMSGYLMGFIFYKKLNRYFIDNNRNNLHGNFLIIFQNGTRNILLGIIHSGFRNLGY